MATERSVLHVLPHPGGGGETYVDLLEGMPGYRFSRVHLAPSPRPSPAIARGLVEAARKSRRHDLVHVHGEVAAALCLPLLRARTSVVTLHGLHLLRRLGGVRRRAAALSLRAVLRAADAVICVSNAEHHELTRIVGAEASKKAVVIRNGIRIPPRTTAEERAAIRTNLGISKADVVAIWVGSLDDRKNPLAAVRAARDAGVTLLVVGDGPLRSDVERSADERVHVLGQRRDVYHLLAASDIYIQTSRREGLSLSLLEAMASGLTPIVTDLPENKEAVGEAGVTVSVADEDAVAQALRRLAARERERSRLDNRARNRVGELFDANRMISATRDTYEAAIRRLRSSQARTLGG